jgi:hypothetical protein
MGALAALWISAGAAAAEERLVLETYPPSGAAKTPWGIVTDKDLGGGFYVELMPADQTPSDYRDILAATSFPRLKAPAADVLQAMLKQFSQAQSCDGLTVDAPKTSQEQGLAVAYARAFCGQVQGQAFGIQIFYKAIEGAEGVYVVSRDFRVPASKAGGTLTFADGQQDQALELMTSIAAGNAWLSRSTYVCGPGSKDTRCNATTPEGALVLISGAELDRLLKSAPYRGLIGKAVAAAPADLLQGCPAATTDRSSVLVLKPISFAANGLPTEGVWKQSFPQAGCRGGVVLNFLFTATPDQRIRTLILEPGDGIAEPRAQVEAFHSAVASVQSGAAGCQALHVLDTRFEAFDHAGKPGPDPAPGSTVDIPWRETWTLGGCGSAWTVPIQFTPAGETTQVAAGKASPKS